MIRQMLRKVVVIEGGDTGLSAGQTLSLNQLTSINQGCLLAGKHPAKFGPTLLGISKASVETDSFLSAASFQETTKVLTEAAINGRVDHLIGLKENVLIGKLIPAGTGMKRYRNVRLSTDVSPEDEIMLSDEESAEEMLSAPENGEEA